jgi:fatty-acyl-CoA synthase
MMNMLPADQLRHHATHRPGKLAVVEGDRRLTYGEFDALADAFAALLRSRGVKPRDRVAILAPSGIDWITYYLGVQRCGGTAVPLNWKLTPAEIANNAKAMDVSLAVVDPAMDTTLAAGIPGGLTLLAGGSGAASVGRLIEPHRGVRIESDVDENDTQAIMLTGGTTGSQKGVMLSHRNIFWNTLQLVIDTEMHEDDVTILATPLHHAGALIIWFLPHLYLGATSVVLPEYSTEALIETIAANRVTNGWTPPSMTRDLLQHPLARERDLSCFRRWYVAGGPFPRRDREEMKALIPGVKIFYQYGLTEAGVMVSVLRDKDYDNAPDSVGRSFSHCDVKIMREDGEAAKPGEVGEILLRSPSVMQGYFRQPESTAQTMRDGWLRTGDLGSMDEAGYIRFHDRLKDMVKTGGNNVYSQEVEQVLQRHVCIREVAVFGVPSAKWGEEVTAVVVLRDGTQATAEDIQGFAREHLARYMVPKQIIFLPYEQLPVNYSGKIVKKDLRQRYAGGTR